MEELAPTGAEPTKARQESPSKIELTAWAATVAVSPSKSGRGNLDSEVVESQNQ
jgi:hypothetical protein